MLVTRFRILMEDGSIHEGPIYGHGGMVGGGTSHLPEHESALASLKRLRHDALNARRGRPVSVATVRPGVCCMYPDFRAEGDGEPIEVNLAQVAPRWIRVRLDDGRLAELSPDGARLHVLSWR